MTRRSLALAVLVALLTAGLANAPARAVTSGLELIQTRQSLLGTHLWYAQTYRGLPVIDGYLAKHVEGEGEDTITVDGRRPILGKVATRSEVAAGAAMAIARSRTGGVAGQAILSVLAGNAARLVWSVISESDADEVRTLVDALTGRVLRVESLIEDVDGTGQVFHPNPVVALKDQSLTDRHDVNYGKLRPAYREVVLTHLDGSGFLRGDFAFVGELRHSPEAFSAGNAFVYTRTDDRFEQVMAYFDVTEAQSYIQSLGFTDVNNEPQDLLPNEYKGDNSFYRPNQDTITLGVGGVDDAEDADVTWHEYGHAIHDDQVPGFGQGHDAGSIGEGFGDYWAVTMSQPVNDGYQVPCVADWDATSYTRDEPHCLRRVDLDLTVEDQTGEIHDDGQIWSRALWDINRGLNRDRANTVILEAQFGFAPDTSFEVAAQITVETAQMLYGSGAAAVVREAFEDRGIL